MNSYQRIPGSIHGMRFCGRTPEVVREIAVRSTGFRLPLGCDTGYGCQEEGDVYGLDEMLGEAGLAAAAEVFVHAVAAHGYGGDDAMGADAADDVVAVAIGQAEVADEEIDGLALGGGGGSRDVRCGDDCVAGALEQAGEGAGGIGVILDEQDAETAGFFMVDGGRAGRVAEGGRRCGR